MITLRETTVTERTLDTPEAIAEHVAAEHARRVAAAPFRAGDAVRLIRRDGVPPEMLVGDVGTVLLCDPAYSPLTMLLGLNAQGVPIHFPVQTANLALAAAPAA